MCQYSVFYGEYENENDCLIDQASDVLSIIICFIISCKVLCKIPFNLSILFFITLQKQK